MPTESRARARLRTELLRVRNLAGLSGRGIADAIGSTQGTVWRVEHGKALLSLPKIEAWLQACRVDVAEQVRLLELAETVHGETRPWRELLADKGHVQEEVHDAESSTALVQNFQATIVPGLLQTPEYARRVLSLGQTRDVAAAVAVRIERQRALHEDGTRFEFAISERALRASLGDPEILRMQRDRLVSLAELPSVTIAVVPDAVAALPWHAFVLWTDPEGNQRVTTELVHGAQEITDAESVGIYVNLWRRLWSAAALGAEAVELIRAT